MYSEIITQAIKDIHSSVYNGIDERIIGELWIIEFSDIHLILNDSINFQNI